jgi:hypothetical protein
MLDLVSGLCTVWIWAVLPELQSETNINNGWLVGWLNCCWPSLAQHFLVWRPVGTHDHNFLFKTSTCFEIGPHLQREEETTPYWGPSYKLRIGQNAVDSRQHSHSMFRVRRDSRTFIAASWLGVVYLSRNLSESLSPVISDTWRLYFYRYFGFELPLTHSCIRVSWPLKDTLIWRFSLNMHRV